MFVFLPVERQADEWQEGTRVSWPIHLLRLEWAVLQHRVQMAFALPLARIYDVLSLKSLSAECVLSFYCTRWCSIHEPIYSGWVSLQVVALSLSYFSSFHICVCVCVYIVLLYTLCRCWRSLKRKGRCFLAWLSNPAEANQRASTQTFNPNPGLARQRWCQLWSELRELCPAFFFHRSLSITSHQLLLRI